MARKKRRKVTREFKLEAVRKVIVDDRTYTDVGKEVGVSEGVLGRWVREFTEDEQEAFPGKGVVSRRIKRSSSSSGNSTASARSVTF